MDDKEHILHYTFLKPNIDVQTDSSLGLHISVSRTYETICDEIMFRNTVSDIASRQESISGLFSHVVNYGADNTVPAIRVVSSELQLFHKRLMFALLMHGSIYTDKYMFGGGAKPVKKGDKWSVVKSNYNPHMVFPRKEFVNITNVLGKNISSDALYSVVKEYGVWKDVHKHSFSK